MQDEFAAELASIVVYHRKKSGLNRIELARLSGVGKTVIYDIEHGKLTVRLDTIIKVLNGLNLRIQLTGPLMKKYIESKNEKG